MTAVPDKLGLLQCHLTGHGCGLAQTKERCGGVEIGRLPYEATPSCPLIISRG